MGATSQDQPSASLSSDGEALLLPYLSPSDLEGSADEEDFLIEGYLALGAKTLVSAQPKAGKSFLAFGMADALLHDEEQFIGKAVDLKQSIGVLFCTEEVSKRGLRVKRDRFNLTDDDHFKLLRHVDVMRLDPTATWPQIVTALHADAKALKAQWQVERLLIVVDGLTKWAGFDEGQENDASVTGAAIAELDAIAEADCAVLILAHAGWAGEHARGSTRIQGEVDVLLFILGEGSDPRILKHKGGRLGETVPELNYRLTDNGLEALGEGNTPRAAHQMDRILRYLEDPPEGKPLPTTEDLAIDVLELKDTRQTLRYLGKLEKRHKIARTEEGRGTPEYVVRWRRTSPVEELLLAGSDTAVHEE